MRVELATEPQRVPASEGGLLKTLVITLLSCTLHSLGNSQHRRGWSVTPSDIFLFKSFFSFTFFKQKIFGVAS